MDNDVYQVVTENIVPVEIVIQSKADIGYRTARVWTSNGSPHKVCRPKSREAYMRIVLNIADIIKSEGPP